MIDFPALIERAYEDGVRVFVEVGPGSSCYAVDRPDSRLAAASGLFGLSGPRAIRFWRSWTSLARLIAEGVPVTWQGFMGKESLAEQPIAAGTFGSFQRLRRGPRLGVSRSRRAASGRVGGCD